MKVKIIFPPLFEPFQPYLSLPYIKGLLNKCNIESECFDSNIEFYLWCFNNKLSLISSDNISERGKYLLANIEKAIDNIKKGTFYPKYRWAMNVIEGFLSLIYPNVFRISLYSLDFEQKYKSLNVKTAVDTKNTIFEKFFDDFEVNIIGENISYYFFSIVVIDQLIPTLKFAKKIKEKNSLAKIVLGGAWISTKFDTLKEIEWIKDYIDILSPGEGYVAINKIFNSDLLSDEHISPDYSDLTMTKYISPEIVIPYIIAHGCKWGKCNFCSHHSSYNSYRTSTIDEVIKDISDLVTSYNIKYISFSDEFIPASLLSEFAKKINAQGLIIRWSTFVRSEKQFTNQEFTDIIYNSGGRLLFFGFESLSQRLLNLMNKGNNPIYYEKILKSCYYSNISFRLDFMFDYPSETEDDFQKTIDFIKKNHIYIDSPFSSYAAAIFEFKVNAPILDSYNNELRFLRGDLDDQYTFCNRTIDDFNKSINKRAQVLIIYKNMRAEIFTPINKTHQLIYKDYYDDNKINLPSNNIRNLVDDNKNNLSWNEGMIIRRNLDGLFVRNLSNNCTLQFSIELSHLIENILGCKIKLVHFGEKQSQLKTLTNSALHYLLRNDCIFLEN